METRNAAATLQQTPSQTLWGGLRNTQTNSISEELLFLIKSCSIFREEKSLQVTLVTKPTLVLHRYYTFSKILRAKSNLLKPHASHNKRQQKRKSSLQPEFPSVMTGTETWAGRKGSKIPFRNRALFNAIYKEATWELCHWCKEKPIEKESSEAISHWWAAECAS